VNRLEGRHVSLLRRLQQVHHGRLHRSPSVGKSLHPFPHGRSAFELPMNRVPPPPLGLKTKLKDSKFWTVFSFRTEVRRGGTKDPPKGESGGPMWTSLGGRFSPGRRSS